MGYIVLFLFLLAWLALQAISTITFLAFLSDWAFKTNAVNQGSYFLCKHRVVARITCAVYDPWVEYADPVPPPPPGFKLDP